VSGWRALDSGDEGFVLGGAAAAACGAGAASPLQQQPAAAGAAAAGSKFDRILRFVEQHDLAGAAAPHAPEAQAWHVSYDEEAEEGCEPGSAAALPAHEAAHLAHAAAALAAAAPSFPSCSVAFLYPGEAAAADLAAAAAPSAVGSVAYFAARPWDHSYDEEAEGCFEAASAAARAARAARLALFNERRVASRAAARARRAALAHSLGDLEAMAPWVGEEDAAAARRAAAAAKIAVGRMPTSRYPHLTALLAAREGAMGVIEALQRERGLQARRPQQWQYTWDEEVFDDGVALSSM
jgi:hypothetical protein